MKQRAYEWLGAEDVRLVYGFRVSLHFDVVELSFPAPLTFFMSHKMCNVDIVIGSDLSNKMCNVGITFFMSNKLCNVWIENSCNWSNKFFSVQITFFMSNKMCNVKIIFSMSSKLFNKGITFFMSNKMCNVGIVIGSDLSVMLSVDRLMVLRAYKSTRRI